VPFSVGPVSLVPAGAFSLVRVAAGPAASNPVLLVDDGQRVHHIEPLPGGAGGQFGYGVPSSLLKARSALALDAGARGRIDLPPPVLSGA
jgi:hypothetical protein